MSFINLPDGTLESIGNISGALDHIDVKGTSTTPDFSLDIGGDGPAIRAGWARIHLPVESIEHGTRRLLAFGADAEVLGPAALRRSVVDALAATQSRYTA